jgi:hypothetical protein
MREVRLLRTSPSHHLTPSMTVYLRNSYTQEDLNQIDILITENGNALAIGSVSSP